VWSRADFLKPFLPAAAVVLGLVGPSPALAQGSAADPNPSPSVELLMDSSGSMNADDGSGTKKIDAAKTAVNDLVESLPRDTRVGLRVFGGRLPNKDKARGCRDTRQIFSVERQDPADVRRVIEGYRPTGFTPIALSLERAAKDLPSTGRRTIVLVSDGEDTCKPPSPCSVAARVARKGVDIKIEAVGLRVNAKARRELQCVARVGRGSYRDADNAQELGQELRAISTRAVRAFEPQGKRTRCGASARRAAELQPGQYVDAMRPASQCWYKIRLDRGETLTAAASLIPPKGGVAAVGSVFRLKILNPVFADQISPGQVANANLFISGGSEFSESLGVYGQPAGSQGDQTVEYARDDKFGRTGFYYLGVEFEDSNDRELRDESDARPFPVELLIDVLGRKPAAARPASTPAGSPVRAAAADSGGGPSGLVAALAAAVAALVGAAAGLGLMRRRRGRAA